MGQICLAPERTCPNFMAPFLQWETCRMPCRRALAHIRQARDRQAVLGIQGAGLDPILSAGWGQGTREKDVRLHCCSSISPQSVRPSKACVWSVWSLKAHGGLELIFSGLQAQFPSVGRVSQKLPLASMAHE